MKTSIIKLSTLTLATVVASHALAASTNPLLSADKTEAAKFLFQASVAAEKKTGAFKNLVSGAEMPEPGDGYRYCITQNRFALSTYHRDNSWCEKTFYPAMVSYAKKQEGQFKNITVEDLSNSADATSLGNLEMAYLVQPKNVEGELKNLESPTGLYVDMSAKPNGE